MTLFNSLPSEILSLILEYINGSRWDLYACALTNKQLYLITQPLLWHALQNMSRYSASCLFIKLKTDLDASERYPPSIKFHICKLRLYDSGNFWTDSRMLILMRFNPQLEEFYVAHEKRLTDASMIHLPKYWPQLHTLSFSHMPGITQQCMDVIGQHLPKLTKLVLDGCEQLRLGSGTFAPFKHFPHLQTLNVREWSPVVLETDMVMWDLIIYLPWLTDLTLDCGTKFMKQLFLAAVGDDIWLNLISLTLYHYYVSDDGAGGDDPLVTFLRYHPRIQRLYFRKCAFVKEKKGLKDLVAVVLPCLTELHFTDGEKPGIRSDYGIDFAHAIRHWIQVCPQLGFVLFWGYGITSPMFPEAGVKCEDMRGCHTEADCHFLHHLDQDDIEKVRDGYLPML